MTDSVQISSTVETELSGHPKQVGIERQFLCTYYRKFRIFRKKISDFSDAPGIYEKSRSKQFQQKTVARTDNNFW
jgi:hypothetical protein